MAVKKNGLGKGLGKGLDSLIPPSTTKKTSADSTATAPTEEKTSEQMIKITKIEPNRSQPRRNFEEDSLIELADSIKQYGVLQPLIVQKKDDYYDKIGKFVNEYVYNLGTSAAVGARYIIESIKKKVKERNGK